jgi:hypothetical protein
MPGSHGLDFGVHGENEKHLPLKFPRRLGVKSNREGLPAVNARPEEATSKTDVNCPFGFIDLPPPTRHEFMVNEAKSWNPMCLQS